jgi:hypothetical protein
VAVTFSLLARPKSAVPEHQKTFHQRVQMAFFEVPCAMIRNLKEICKENDQGGGFQQG